ncbi:MAG: undecaprenyldiphospho-muramoylpentapeptide beta-N-acetylglucosaminyltransferase [Candidatus Cloacimonetes bacterium]|nr:undecaprenyldiphospho-muramoylpentapeptide beta-N-acetylglucosaminyltransferase [Candidatus Cloacimonadota bacterium]MBS3766646.1 undecaprenyldiphospho-muramoylpentapeptide beta-N-acetylglucosaminyltransferase [Candidatus Cloacimonadota bacterium]
MLKVAIATGGSGGHIFPAVSVAEELKRQFENVDIIFIGSHVGIEEDVLTNYDYPLYKIDVRRFNRYFTYKNLILPFFVGKSTLQSVVILQKHKCDLLIGFGGFSAGVAVLAAKLLSIPIFLQEQNSYPGLVTRKTACLSTKIFLGNFMAKKYLKKYSEKLIYSGNPLRKLEQIPKLKALKKLGLQNKNTIFVYGGSQGSMPLNKFLAEIINDLLIKDIQIIWQTGEKENKILKNKFGQNESVLIKPFFTQMSYVYCACDLVVCRAGAISIAEAAHFGLPAIIIPFPYAADDHQLKNAQLLEDKKAAFVLIEDNLTADLLKQKIIDLLASYQQRDTLSNNIKKLSIGNSSEIIVNEIKRSLGKI